MNEKKKFLDLVGLTTYHQLVENALNEKANKTHIGASQPTDSKIEVWFDTTKEENQNGEEVEVEVASYNEVEEELTFNDSDEELTFNED